MLIDVKQTIPKSIDLYVKIQECPKSLLFRGSVIIWGDNYLAPSFPSVTLGIYEIKRAFRYTLPDIIRISEQRGRPRSLDCI